jgi:anaerobic ribonucleoside-triphosphate reductase activating protein
MRIHAVMECSLANGPGRRAVIWFQGCELACPGCWNPRSHRRDAGVRSAPFELVPQILQAHASYRIEGVTVSGGEPVHQIESLIAFLSMLKDAGPNLSAGLFTGYTERELEQGRFETYSTSDPNTRQAAWRNLRKLLDFGVFGRYNQHQPCSQPLVSSGNQQLRLFSGRYAQKDFKEQSLEVNIGSDGLTQITGFPRLGAID